MRQELREAYGLGLEHLPGLPLWKVCAAAPPSGHGQHRRPWSRCLAWRSLLPAPLLLSPKGDPLP